MASSSPPRPPVVLVVEDEALLRMHATDMIEAAGYTVVEAANADEAVLILSQRMDIRIVFTDIDMPGSMDGLKLAAMVRDRWPPIELIVTSGVHHAQACTRSRNAATSLPSPTTTTRSSRRSAIS